MSTLLVIPAAQVREGMFIRDLRMSWWQHDFLRQRFRVASAADLQRVRALGRHEVVVDLRQSDPEAVRAMAEPPPAVAAAGPRPAQPVEATPPVPAPAPRQERVSRLAELEVARTLTHRARQAVDEAMRDARAGRLADVSDTRAVAGGMVDSMTRNPDALLSLSTLKSRDDYTFAHCVSVGALMIALGMRLGLSRDELSAVGQAGLLHDIGKAATPLELLNKPGKLTAQEFAVIRQHPQLGSELLTRCGFDEAVALDVVRHHHERIDGAGYPFGLAGEALSLHARMSAVCDVYDAVTSNRAYHRAMPPTQALQLLLRGAGSGHFDGRLVRALVHTLGIYPTLSVVRLESDRLAVVMEQCEFDITRPHVRVFYACGSGMRVPPYDIALSRSNEAIAGIADLAAHGLPEGTAAVVAGLA